MAAMPLHLIGYLINFAIAPASMVERAAKALAFVAGGLRARIIAMQATAKRILFPPLRDQLLGIGATPRLRHARPYPDTGQNKGRAADGKTDDLGARSRRLTARYWRHAAG